MLSGRVPVGRMPRLAESLASLRGEASVELRFGREPGGRHLIEVSGSVEVELQCQRCLENCWTELTAVGRLILVSAESEAESLPAEFDALVDSGRVRTLDLIEDEFILALPLIPMHQAGASECIVSGEFNTGWAEPARMAQRENPFAALAKLKKPDHTRNS